MRRMWVLSWSSCIFTAAAALAMRPGRMVTIEGVKDFVLPTVTTNVPDDPLDCPKYIIHTITASVLKPQWLDYGIACIAFYLSGTPDMNAELSDIPGIAKVLKDGKKGISKRLFSYRLVKGGPSDRSVWTSDKKFAAVRLAIFEGQNASLKDPLRWTYAAWCLVPRLTWAAKASLPRTYPQRRRGCVLTFGSAALQKWTDALLSGEPIPRFEYAIKLKWKPDTRLIV